MKKIDTIIKGELYVLVDFDGTITCDRDNNFGEYTLKDNCKEVLLELSNIPNIHFGIWSCRGVEQLENAKLFLEKQGLLHIFEHFNGDFYEIAQFYGGKPTRKASADIYLDDRANFYEIDWLDIKDKLTEIAKSIEGDANHVF